MRAFNRVLSAVVAVALAGAGVLIAIEVLVARTHWPQTAPLIVPWVRWRDELRPHSWNDTVVVLVCIAAIVVGLLLIVAAALARDRRIVLTSPNPGVELSTSPGSMARALRREATTVDGIAGAKARVRRRSARVRAEARFGAGPDLQQDLRQHLQDRMASLSPDPPRDVDVRVRTRRRK